MANDGLVGRYRRTAVGPRVSLTDKCKLRFRYCTPAERLDWLPGPQPFGGDWTRLTADGQVRSRLFSRAESDLRTALRAGFDDEEIADQRLAAIAGKLPGQAINDPSFSQPARPMSAIGG